jgi:hypothetical protein
MIQNTYRLLSASAHMSALHWTLFKHCAVVGLAMLLHIHVITSTTYWNLCVSEYNPPHLWNSADRWGSRCFDWKRGTQRPCCAAPYSSFSSHSNIVMCVGWYMWLIRWVLVRMIGFISTLVTHSLLITFNTAIQHYCWFTPSTAHRCTRTRILSFH